MLRKRYEVTYIKNPNKIEQIQETKLSKENFQDFIKRMISNSSEDEKKEIKIPNKPIFKGNKKTFPNFKEKKESSKGFRESLFGVFSSTKEEKIDESTLVKHPLYINEKAEIINGFCKSKISFIENSLIPMRLDYFLSQFTSEKDLENLELSQIFDIDYDKLEELKNKALEFINATAQVVYEKENLGEDKTSEEETVIFFTEKLQELRANDINIQICIQNIGKIVGIIYEPNGARVLFKKV